MAKKILKSIAEVEEAMNELQREEAKLEVKMGEANTKIADVRDEFKDETATIEERVKRLRSSIESWAEDNRDDEELFPNGKKSLELQAGTISFRLGAEKVVLKKGVKTSDVIDNAQELGVKGILSKPDPTLDKTAVKELFESGKIDAATLKKLGLEITQDETLKIDLKKVEAYA
jgi:phage host-nuclease inhibitor protein Gam